MSLTREQWCEMWESIKNIESFAKTIQVFAVAAKKEGTKVKVAAILGEVNVIKDQIQSVIGQME